MTLQHQSFQDHPHTRYAHHTVYGPHGVLEYKRHPDGDGDLDHIVLHRTTCWDGCEAAADLPNPCTGGQCELMEAGCHWAYPHWLDALAGYLRDLDEATLWRLLDETYPTAMTATAAEFEPDHPRGRTVRTVHLPGDGPGGARC